MNSKVSDILSKIGASREALFFFGLYKNTDPTRFAVIKIGGESIEKSLEEIANDLTDLYALGFIPVVTHGWGSALTRRLKSLGIDSQFINGDRYTDAVIMSEVREIADETNTALSRAIIAMGGKAQVVGYSEKPLVAKDKESAMYGEHNGDVIAVNTEPIFRVLLQGFIPIISPIGISADGRKIYNINADVAGAELVRVIDPVKYVMITDTGGVLTKKGDLISEIILRRYLSALIEDGTISGGMLKKVEEASRSLEIRPNGDDKSVQIVKPGSLLYELFTHKGAGTYIRNGYVIEARPIEAVNQRAVRSLIENRFQEELKEDYFCDGTKMIYIERNFKGLGITIPDPIGVCPYLDILVVDNGYGRNGLATDIITALLESQSPQKQKLFWRSKTIRDANSLYFRMADGHQVFVGSDGHSYNGFWIGLTLDEAKKALMYMQQKPSNFK